MPGRPRVVTLPGHTPGSVGYLFADRGLLFTGDALVTYDAITGYHGPAVASRAFTHDSRAALASLTTLGTINAGLLLPGHGEPFTGAPADAAAQARTAGLHLTTPPATDKRKNTNRRRKKARDTLQERVPVNRRHWPAAIRWPYTGAKPASAVNGSSPSGPWTTCPGGGGPARSGWATAPGTSASMTSGG